MNYLGVRFPEWGSSETSKVAGGTCWSLTGAVTKCLPSFPAPGSSPGRSSATGLATGSSGLDLSSALLQTSCSDSSSPAARPMAIPTIRSPDPRFLGVQLTPLLRSPPRYSRASRSMRAGLSVELVMAPHPNQVAEEDQQCDHLQGHKPAGRGEEHGQRKQHKPSEAQARCPARPNSFGGVALGLVLHESTARREGMALANHPNRVRGPRCLEPRLLPVAVAEVVEVAPTPNLLGVGCG